MRALGPRDPLGPEELARLAGLAMLASLLWTVSRVLVNCWTWTGGAR